jgi:hypothetical protein
MTRINALEEFGVELDLAAELQTASPVICDARMLPHEFLLTSSGRLLKCDAAVHGDDHFFPGACDIAWDLAGAIIEWQMKRQAAEFFCRRFQQLTGDATAARLPAYLLAYSLFRIGYCSFAAEAMSGTAEQQRFEALRSHYRHRAEKQLYRLAVLQA